MSTSTTDPTTSSGVPSRPSPSHTTHTTNATGIVHDGEGFFNFPEWFYDVSLAAAIVHFLLIFIPWVYFTFVKWRLDRWARHRRDELLSAPGGEDHDHDEEEGARHPDHHGHRLPPTLTLGDGHATIPAPVTGGGVRGGGASGRGGGQHGPRAPGLTATFIDSSSTMPSHLVLPQVSALGVRGAALHAVPTVDSESSAPNTDGPPSQQFIEDDPESPLDANGGSTAPGATATNRHGGGGANGLPRNHSSGQVAAGSSAGAPSGSLPNTPGKHRTASGRGGVLPHNHSNGSGGGGGRGFAFPATPDAYPDAEERRRLTSASGGALFHDAARYSYFQHNGSMTSAAGWHHHHHHNQPRYGTTPPNFGSPTTRDEVHDWVAINDEFFWQGSAYNENTRAQIYFEHKRYTSTLLTLLFVVAAFDALYRSLRDILYQVMQSPLGVAWKTTNATQMRIIISTLMVFRPLEAVASACYMFHLMCVLQQLTHAHLPRSTWLKKLWGIILVALGFALVLLQILIAVQDELLVGNSLFGVQDFINAIIFLFTISELLVAIRIVNVMVSDASLDRRYARWKVCGRLFMVLVRVAHVVFPFIEMLNSQATEYQLDKEYSREKTFDTLIYNVQPCCLLLVYVVTEVRFAWRNGFFGCVLGNNANPAIVVEPNSEPLTTSLMSRLMPSSSVPV